MIAVIQRAKSASVSIEGVEVAAIANGLVVLLGIEEADNQEDIQWLSKKICNLRIFDDQDGVMNKSCLDVEGDVLLISQFTLHASTRKGNRPSYLKAAKPDIAIPIYEDFIKAMNQQLKNEVKTGKFGAEMDVSLINWGPVTIIIDTKDKK
jgi:D-tyrosyl-tRNA(Tyr) deacylase